MKRYLEATVTVGGPAMRTAWIEVEADTFHEIEPMAFDQPAQLRQPLARYIRARRLQYREKRSGRIALTWRFLARAIAAGDLVDVMQCELAKERVQ